MTSRPIPFIIDLCISLTVLPPALLESWLLHSKPSMMDTVLQAPSNLLTENHWPGMCFQSPPEMTRALPLGLKSNCTPPPCLCLELQTSYFSLSSPSMMAYGTSGRRKGVQMVLSLQILPLACYVHVAPNCGFRAGWACEQTPGRDGNKQQVLGEKPCLLKTERMLETVGPKPSPC